MLKMTWFRRKKYLLVQMFLHHFLGFSIFKIFHTWSSYFDSKIKIYNMLCWCSGKDTGLSPGRPQFKSHLHQGFLQKDLPWKFFNKWLSIRRITVWITSRSQSLPTPVIDHKSTQLSKTVQHHWIWVITLERNVSNSVCWWESKQMQISRISPFNLNPPLICIFTDQHGNL